MKTFLSDTVVPYEADEVTRLIIDRHDATAFLPISHMTVGEFRNFLLPEQADSQAVIGINPASDAVEVMAELTPLFDEIIAKQEIPTNLAFSPTSPRQWAHRTQSCRKSRLSSFPENREIDPEASVCRLRSGDRLKHEIDRCSAARSATT